MKHESHKTRIAIIREHVTAWRRDMDWSRETAATEIVAAHERIGGPAATNITFDKSGDAFAAAKRHADRIWRWLDDESKENNLLPANFENSILAAMPVSRRVHCVSDLLESLDVSVTERGAVADGHLSVELLAQCIKEDGESQVAFAHLIESATDADFSLAEREAVESIAMKTRLLDEIRAARAAAREAPVRVPGPLVRAVR